MRSIWFMIIFSFSTSQSLITIENHIKILIESVQHKLKPLGNLQTNDPYANLTINEFVNLNGYHLETYQVTTEDGYILTLHRIPHGRNDIASSSSASGSSTKPVIVFKAGFSCSSWDFLYLGRNQALGMLLADLGYDIWLINTRGNRYSIKHKIYNSSYDSKEFWNFSFHEKGHYDIPASIDFIRNKTNVPNVTFIGHSQGTIEGLVTLITRPEYQKKINLLVLLSPVIYLSNTISPLIAIIYKYQKQIKATVKTFHIEGVPFDFQIASARKELCGTGSAVQSICLTILEEACGPDYDQFNKTLSSFYFANYPDGISIKELLHYSQEIESGEFRQYDYGDDNVIHYNRTTPPNYNISSVQTPIAAYYGKNDYIASLTDVDKFLKQVPNLVVSHLIDYDQFNHLDFILGMDVKEMLYDDIIEQVEKYNPLK